MAKTVQFYEDNVLNQYDNVTYNWTIYMVRPEDANLYDDNIRGNRVKINSFEFEGNEKIKSYRLRKKMKNTKLKKAKTEKTTEKKEKYKAQSYRLSKEDVDNVKKLLSLMGVSYIQADGEAEGEGWVPLRDGADLPLRRAPPVRVGDYDWEG